MKRTIIILCALLFVLTSFAQTIKIAAAANLRNVLDEIKVAYLKENPKAKLEITYGASGNLTQQILNGASFDFFMAADNEFPLKLQQKKATIRAMKVYAYGKLVMWSNSVDVSKGLEVLSSPNVKKIAIAKPETAPYGERSVEFLKKRNVINTLSSKIVYADNISQAAQFATTGNAEIAFTALSLAFSPEMKKEGQYYLVPESDYTPIAQACVLLKTKIYNPAAAKFMQYVLSPQTESLWLKWGYGIKK